jgi:hypothetical protein
MNQSIRRTEYRVVGDNAISGLPTEISRSFDLDRCHRKIWWAKELGYKNPHIEIRTVTRTPWVDLPEQGEQ